MSPINQRQEMITHLDTMDLRPSTLNSLPQCPRCAVKTDTLYAMLEVNGKWEEVLDTHEFGGAAKFFCYKCCDELEGGTE